MKARNCLDCGIPLLITPHGWRRQRCEDCNREKHRLDELARQAALRPPERQAALDEYRSLWDQGLKRCTVCGEVLPFSEFNHSGAKGRNAGNLRGECKLCYQQREASRVRDQKKTREAMLRRSYGITIDEYDRLLQVQGGVCAICLAPPGDEPLHVDHCHETGAVRGLLCSRCNTALGLLEEDMVRTKRLLKYMEVARLCKSVSAASGA